MRLWWNLPHHLNCVLTLLRKFKQQHFSVKNAIILCSFTFIAKRKQKKSSPVICFSLRYSELSWDLSSGAVCLGLILQVPHSVNVLSSARRARTPLPGARSMDPVVHNRFWKSSTPRLLHLLFGNSLINRFTPYLLIPRHFYQCPVFFC